MSSVVLPGFVDHHAHLLRLSTAQPAEWAAGGVRQFHEHCAEAGYSPIDAPVAAPDRQGLASKLLAGLEGAASVGIVEIWEAGMADWVYLEALKELRDRGDLRLRVRLLVAAALAEKGMPARLGDSRLEIAGVKFYADGWLGPRTCAVSRPFLDEPWNTGILFEGAAHLAARVAPLAEQGWSIATHAIGDRAIESVIDAYELVYGSDCREQAPRIEHVQLARPDLISRMAEMGVVACVQPGFGLDDGEHLRRALGTNAPAAYRTQALLDAGVRVVTGSDYPIDSLAPLSGLWKFLSNPLDSLDAATALGLMTDAAAGTVRLSEDPTAVAVDEILRIAVEGTSVN